MRRIGVFLLVVVVGAVGLAFALTRNEGRAARDYPRIVTYRAPYGPDRPGHGEIRIRPRPFEEDPRASEVCQTYGDAHGESRRDLVVVTTARAGDVIRDAGFFGTSPEPWDSVPTDDVIVECTWFPRPMEHTPPTVACSDHVIVGLPGPTRVGIDMDRPNVTGPIPTPGLPSRPC